LTLIVSSLGTSYEIQTDDKILFLEDTGEPPYKLDRMLTQLKHANKFKKVKGIIFGKMHQCDPLEHQLKNDPQTFSAKMAIIEALGDLSHKIPVLYDFPSGHGPTQIAFPIGLPVRIQTHSPQVVFLESLCR
jgi:muramoyltetrapeptide carboxypeptidase